MGFSVLDKFAYSISARSRSQKFQFFIHKICPQWTDTIVDVGVNAKEYSGTDNYLEKHHSHPENITGVSLNDVNNLRAMYPKCSFVQANGTNLPFPDDEFDIAYSNAVIEHVGKFEAQKRFLQELIRVSKRGYITTPNKFFPIEVHTRIPLLHILLPKEYFDRFLKFIGKGWATGDYMNLLSRDDLAKLAGTCQLERFEIYPNRFLGFPMTFTMLWQKERSAGATDRMG